jgi:hypothetical protein
MRDAYTYGTENRDGLKTDRNTLDDKKLMMVWFGMEFVHLFQLSARTTLV